MKWLRYAVPLGAFVVLAAFLAVGLDRNPREVPSPLIGKPAPTFALATLHEPQRTITTQSLRGQPWILNVWASWCVACREEHPLLVAFAKRKSVALYGLNYKDQRDAGIRWLNALGNPYDASLFDADGRLGLDFGVYGVPETFVVDAQGVVRYKHIGPLTPAVLENKIEPLLKTLQTGAANG
jgi:cytochrome c biogenesis protein CcmG, thiol:disulfide interchange protein DsbE